MTPIKISTFTTWFPVEKQIAKGGLGQKGSHNGPSNCSRFLQPHHRRRAQKHVAGMAKNGHLNREKSGKSRENKSIEQLKIIHLTGRMNGNILVNKPNILETYWSIHLVEPNKYQPPGGWLPHHHHDDVPVDHALTIPWLSIHVSVRKKVEERNTS